MEGKLVIPAIAPSKVEVSMAVSTLRQQLIRLAWQNPDLRSDLIPLLRVSRKDKVPGGLADRCQPKDFDKDQLKAGQKIEMEHTKDPSLALEIAMDHLKEDPQYYVKLKRVEQS